jgi:hypothetical protein
MTTLRTNKAEQVIQYEFVDQGQNVWIVPAEILPTKFKDAFILHKSIGLDNDSWTVTHAESGISFVISPGKAEAIEAATELINAMSYEDLMSAVTPIDEAWEESSPGQVQHFLH